MFVLDALLFYASIRTKIYGMFFLPFFNPLFELKSPVLCLFKIGSVDCQPFPIFRRVGIYEFYKLVK